MRNRIISGIVLALIAVACTVKEDRSYCPALCVVYSDGYVADGCAGDLTYSVTSEGRGNLDAGTGALSNFTEKGNMVFEVPRNENVYVDVFCGVYSMSMADSALRIPLGCSCDRIYSGHGHVLISGEGGEAGLPLHKDFVCLSVRLKSDGLEELPFFLRIRGNVDGYVLPGGSPHRGEFDYRPPEEGKGCFKACIPRQTDDSLRLDICRTDDASTVESCALGKMISAMGFDWTRPDLRDLELTVKLAEVGFEIQIKAWEESGTINIII